MNKSTFKHIIVALFLFATCFNQLTASEFMDSSPASKPIGLGIRLGITSSSVGMNTKDIYPDLKKGITEWGAGFEVGAVVNLNIKNFFTLQPGFFFQNKSYNSTLINMNSANQKLENALGHSRFYYFQIPVLCSFRFNITNELKWNVDFGPYFAFGIGGDTKYESFSTEINNGNAIIESRDYKYDYFGDSNSYNVRMKSFDWGFKIGTGLTFLQHYSLSVYYNIGCKNVANNHQSFLKDPSAKNKQWSFTLGYDF
ncbi:MAG: porin family protein [Muribaculaceae bacterium]|nr:porin family protein [Muribaculaceae bacterium]